jgi:MFS family permease
MFIFGGIPALMIAFIRYGVHESKRWHEKFGNAPHRRPTMSQSFGALFSPAYKRNTIVMSGLFLVSIILLWAGSIYVPTATTQLALRAGATPADAARVASYASGVLAIGTILGCILVPFIAETLGRRPTMGILLTVLGISAGIGFGYVFYLPDYPIMLFMLCVFFMGVGGANFADYTIWLPELYTTDCRASAIGFISSIGRFVGVAMVFVLGNAIAAYGSLGLPVAVVAMAFVFGLILLPFAKETKGQALPA